MAQYIQKKFQQTPLNIGKIEDSLQSGSPTNAPSIRALLEALYHSNLLINGDFKCNQRGQSSYAINGAYSLDMWLIKQGLKVDIISNGIRITQRDDGAIFLLQQFIQSEMSNNQSFTLGIKSGGKVNSATFVYDDTNHTSSLDAPFVFENAEVGIKVFNHNGKNVFQIYLKVRTLDIEYIDLFEGDIAYPHVKEDYAIALIRCQSEIRPLGRNFIGYSSSSNNHMFIPYAEIAEMKQQSNNISIINKDSGINLCIDGKQLKSTNYYIDLAEDYMHISFNDISVPVNTTIGGWFNSLIIMISCEPL